MLWTSKETSRLGGHCVSVLRFHASGFMFASLLRLPTLSYTVDSLLRFAPVASFAPAHVALRAAFGRLPSQRPLACVRSRSVDSQDLPTCSSFGAALRQSIIDLSQRSRFALRANLRLVYLAPAPALDCLSPGICSIARVFAPHSCRPSGCLRQATQPAPTGMFS